jgi:hypothetical protein
MLNRCAVDAMLRSPAIRASQPNDEQDHRSKTGWSCSAKHEVVKTIQAKHLQNSVDRRLMPFGLAMTADQDQEENGV